MNRTILKKTVWIIMGHPLQLPLALAIAREAPENLQCNLLVSRHKMWKNIETAELASNFKIIIFFEPIYYADSILEIGKIIFALIKTRKMIRKLPIKTEDILLSLEVWNYVENLITTVFAKNKQILLCPEGIRPFVSMSSEKIKALPGGRISKAGYLHHFFIEPLLQLKKLTFFYWVKTPRLDHGIAYEQDIAKLYDRVLILKSLFKTDLAAGEMHYPYPILKKADEKTNEQKRIVFFLTGYVKNENYYGKISQILSNLKRIYSAAHLLEIRLNPNYPDAYRQIDTGGWVINREPGNAEQYLIRHASEIAGAFSHISTTMIFALNLGLPAYSYHRCMDFEQDYVAWHDNTYRDAPSEFFMKSFNQTPEPYQPIPDDIGRSRQSLNKLYEILQNV